MVRQSHVILAGSLLVLVGAAVAQSDFRSSDGRFTAQVPQGWNIVEDRNSGQVKLSQGKVSASLGVAPTDNGQTPPASEVLDGITQQFKEQCPSTKVVNHGTTALSGLTGEFALLSCDDPRGRVMSKISVATSHGEILIFNSAAPAADYAKVLPTLNAVEKSFRLAPKNSSGGAAGDNTQKIKLLQQACTSGVLTQKECAAKMAALSGNPAPSPRAQDGSQATSPQAASVGDRDGRVGTTLYRDPNGRFSVGVPQGWSATPEGENGDHGVLIRKGSSWAIIGPYDNVRSTAGVVNGLASEFQPDYRDFQLGDSGSLTVNGHDAAYGAYAGINSQGEHVGLRFAGIAAPGGHFLAMAASIPHNDIPAVDPVMKDVFMSISFGD